MRSVLRVLAPTAAGVALLCSALLAAQHLRSSVASVAPNDAPPPTLGNYPDTSLPLSGNTTVTPDAAPTNTTSINVSTNTNFNGTFAASPTTGVVIVTDAHPAGTYTVTVTAIGPGGQATKTFTMTVTSGTPCLTPGFTNAADVHTGREPISVAIGDFNGDGKQDLAVANYMTAPGTVSIRLGDGMGGFSSSTDVSVASFPNSVAIGDFNGDGKQDLAVTSQSNSVSIRLGDGMGGFSGATEVTVSSRSFAVAIGDFNGDGKQDLAVANDSTQPSTVSIRLGDGLGGFTGSTEVSVGSGPVSLAIGDFNGDGNQDLAVANQYSNTVSIRLGDGLGGFTGATEVSVGHQPYSVAIGDFNGDGKQDLAVANVYLTDSTVSIRLGDGLGGFSGSTEVCPGDWPSSVAIGDLNRDGKQDLAVANQNSSVSIRLGDGVGGFGSSSEIFFRGSVLVSVAIGDFNGDGRQDLAVVNYFSDTVSIRLGQCILPSPFKALNLSTRMRIQTGGYVGIGGFIITGSAPKRVILRSIGPSLSSIGLSDTLADPIMELHGPPCFVTITNDNWRDTQEAEITATGLAPTNDLEAAIVAQLNPGAYTFIVSGTNNDTGLALIEVYDLNQAGASELANVSTRAFVNTGSDIMIAGFIMGGSSGNDNVIVRGIGPSLFEPGVANPLPDPKLELRNSTGTLIRANDNWMDDPTQKALIMAAGLGPTDGRESAIYETLGPGQYTALLSGVNNGTGVGVVEVYDLGRP